MLICDRRSALGMSFGLELKVFCCGVHTVGRRLLSGVLEFGNILELALSNIYTHALSARIILIG